MKEYNTSIILDSHPDWLKLRNRALEYARKNTEIPKSTWHRQLTCMPGCGILWQWDSCFMALYAGYTPDNLNGLGNLDNMYKMQRDDGYIGMAYKIETEEFLWGERINPPLYAWVEWTYAKRTGDTSRLTYAYPVIKKLFYWIKANRRRENGLYWFEDTGSSGMDNSPRSGYSAYELHGSDVCFIDLACQQVLAARCLAEMAKTLGEEKEASSFEQEADELSTLINKLHWCDKTGFYHDVFVATNNKLANKTAAAFWAIISGVAQGERLAKLAAHLANPETFGTRHPVPSLSRDDPNYRIDGGYWLGSVWAPTNYMIVNGLRRNGQAKLAKSIVERHITCMTELLGSEKFDSIWECYSPELAEPAKTGAGERVRDKFVGWSGLGPIVMIPENIIGLEINALEKTIDWDITEQGRQGLTDFPFNGGSTSLVFDGDKTITIETNAPFKLTVTHSGIKSVTDVSAGSSQVSL